MVEWQFALYFSSGMFSFWTISNDIFSCIVGDAINQITNAFKIWEGVMVNYLIMSLSFFTFKKKTASVTDIDHRQIISYTLVGNEENPEIS